MNLVVQLILKVDADFAGIAIYTGRPSNLPYDRAIISGRCVTRMDQSSTARHRVTVTFRLSLEKSSEDSSFFSFP